MQRLVGVDAEGNDATAQRPLPLSICTMTRSGSSRVVSLLELLQPLAAEIVVALDERSENEAASLTPVADKVILFSHRDPGDSVIPWLHAQCGSSWILNLDDDEVPGHELLLALPELLTADVTHWWLPRRWLFGSAETCLDEPPWVPDYQLRLYRNDPASLRFSDEFHRPVVVSGPAGFARDPLWHLDCVLNPFERRREKALAYERARPGMRVAGLAHNSGFYLPELRPDARTAQVPESDVRLISRVQSEPPAGERVRQGSVRHAGAGEIDAFWPGEPYDRALYEAKLTRLGTLDRLPAGARHTVAIAVENASRSAWRHGPEAAPSIQIGTRWHAGDGTLLEEGLHTPLPADLPAGSSLDVPVHVRAPSRPGRYRLEVDLVHEHVRWFGRPLEWPVEITPARRVALVGGGEPLRQALERLQLEPDVEPILVERDDALPSERYGHRHVPGLGGYLLAGIDDRIRLGELVRLTSRTASLLRRARRLRQSKPSAPLPAGAEECLEELAGCERLLITGPDWDEAAAVTRQLWRLAATTAAARRLGVAVEAELGEFAPAGLLDRLLTRILSRS